MLGLLKEYVLFLFGFKFDLWIWMKLYVIIRMKKEYFKGKDMMRWYLLKIGRVILLKKKGVVVVCIILNLIRLKDVCLLLYDVCIKI